MFMNAISLKVLVLVRLLRRSEDFGERFWYYLSYYPTARCVEHCVALGGVAREGVNAWMHEFQSIKTVLNRSRLWRYLLGDDDDDYDCDCGAHSPRIFS